MIGPKLSLWDRDRSLLHNSAHLSASCTSFSRSLVLPISIPGLGPHSLNALIDSGASDNFLDNSLFSTHPEMFRLLDSPILLQLIDGSPAQSGKITHELTASATVAPFGPKPIRFLVTNLHPSTPVVLGLPWLQDNNPQINWTMLQVQERAITPLDTCYPTSESSVEVTPDPSVDSGPLPVSFTFSISPAPVPVLSGILEIPECPELICSPSEPCSNTDPVMPFISLPTPILGNGSSRNISAGLPPIIGYGSSKATLVHSPSPIPIPKSIPTPPAAVRPFPTVEDEDLELSMSRPTSPGLPHDSPSLITLRDPFPACSELGDTQETFPGVPEPVPEPFPESLEMSERSERSERSEIMEQSFPASGTSVPLGILPEVTTENPPICCELPVSPEPPTPIPCSTPEINIKIIGARAFQLLLDSGETCYQYFAQPQAFSLTPKPLSSLSIVLKDKPLFQEKFRPEITAGVDTHLCYAALERSGINSGTTRNISELYLTPEEVLQFAERLPSQYKEYADVFAKGEAEILPPHHPYDLSI